MRGSMVEVNNATLARWEAGLRRCFKAGVDAGGSPGAGASVVSIYPLLLP